MKLSKKNEKEYFEKFNSLAKFCEAHGIPALIFIPIDEEGYSALFNEGQYLVRRFTRVCMENTELGDAFTAMCTLSMACKASLDKTAFMSIMEAIYESKNIDIEEFLLEEEGEDEEDNPNADC